MIQDPDMNRYDPAKPRKGLHKRKTKAEKQAEEEDQDDHDGEEQVKYSSHMKRTN